MNEVVLIIAHICSFEEDEYIFAYAKSLDRDYDEWIVEDDEGSVKIDLFSFYVRSKNYDYYFYNYLSYHYFSGDELINALQEKQDENTAIDNDL